MRHTYAMMTVWEISSVCGAHSDNSPNACALYTALLSTLLIIIYYNIIYCNIIYYNIIYYNIIYYYHCLLFTFIYIFIIIATIIFNCHRWYEAASIIFLPYFLTYVFHAIKGVGIIVPAVHTLPLLRNKCSLFLKQM